VKNSFSEQLSVLPLFWAALAFLEGILVASQVHIFTTTRWLWMVVLLAAGGLLLTRLRPRLGLLLALLPAIVFSGAARYQSVQPPAEITAASINYYNELPRRIYVTGTLVDAPDVRDTYMNLRLQVDAVDTGEGDRPVHGLLLVRLTDEYDLQYGMRIRVRGFVETPVESEDFSYREYLFMQGIYSTLRTDKVTLLPFGAAHNTFNDWLFRLKNSLVSRVYRLFPDPEASLLAGVLFGVDKNIPAALQQAFKNTGTAHIIAISGFNIAIIAGIFVTIFSRIFGKRLGALLAILGIAGYTVLVGADASVVRAAIMGTLSIIAAQFGRRNVALNALTVSALVMAWFNPFILWDVGFQLSFAATLGLVLYADRIQEAVSGLMLRFLPAASVEKAIVPIADFFLLTLAAQLTTIPIMAYHFGRISLISLVANPFILPAQPAVMVLGGLAVALSRLYMPLGQAVAWLAWPFATYTIRLVEFFDKFKGGVWVLDDFSLLFVILAYIVLFGLTLASDRFRKYFSPAVTIAVLAVLSVLMWRSVLDQPDGRLHVTFLDVGTSDAVLLKTPAGRYLLINGGYSPSKLSNELGRRLPPFGRELDYLVIASTQESEVAALPRTLERFRPAKVLWAGNEQASFSASKLDAWLTGYGVPLRTANTGDELDLGGGAKLRVLAASESGAILAVEWDTFKVILPIGPGFNTLKELEYGKGLGPATALLLAENGYAAANPQEWLDNVQPQSFVLSVAAGDLNGLPAPELLKALEDDNVLRTDVSGWIDFTTDGKQVWITVEKK
jgi:competence protein ComEC